MTRSPPHRRKLLASMTTIFLLGAALLALSTPALAAAPPCNGDDDTADCNNNGDVKVHTANDTGDPKNDPHVDCPFFVEGFNMDAEHGTLEIKSWPPTGDKSVVLTDNWTADDQTQDSHHFNNGPYTLPSGHYKLFVTDEQHTKMKVFWVDCEQQTNTTTETTTGGTSETTSGTPTTEIPFFPTTAALGVGLAGAVIGSLLILRRRL